MIPRPIRRASSSCSIVTWLVLVACALACSTQREERTDVFLRAFRIDGEPLTDARIRFRDGRGALVGEGVLIHGNGFRFESRELGEREGWGRRVRTLDLDADGCASRDDRVAIEEERHRIAVGGHPSLRSKEVTRYSLRATVVCLTPLDDPQRERLERDLHEGDLSSQIRAAVELGWFRVPDGASDALARGMQDAPAIALRLVHHPHPSAVSALIAALDEERESVRFAAAVLLARLGRNEHGVASEALPALERRGEDPSARVQNVVEDAIERITPR